MRYNANQAVPHFQLDDPRRSDVMARSILAKTLCLTLVVLLLAGLAYGQPRPPQETRIANPGEVSAEKAKKLNDQLDRTIDQYITWLTQVYQMDPDQQKQVRNRLQDLKRDHLQYGKKAAAEILPLQQELKFYMEKARKGEPIDKEMVKDLQARLVGVIQQAPMAYNNIIVQSEKLLPADQVTAGRERQKEFKDRMKEFQDRSKRQAPGALPSDLDALKPYLDTSAPDSVASLPPPEPKPATPGDQRGGRIVRPTPAEPERPAVVEVIPLDAWGKYVEDFITRYKLDAKQAEQSRQILGELRRRADEYRQARKPDYQAVEVIKDLPLRNEEITRLDKPIQEMFDELKARVANIPTDEQRKLAAADAPATQPTKAPASRPAVAAKAPVKAPASAPASAPAGQAAAAPK
jgi:hypothetical protein